MAAREMEKGHGILMVPLRFGEGDDLGLSEAQAQLTGTQASFCCSWCRTRHCCSGQRRSDSWGPPGHPSSCKKK